MDDNRLRVSTFAARVWKPDATFVAVRRFEYGERVLEQGEVFPWKEIGISIGQVWQLWVAVLIDAVDVAPSTTAEPKRKNKKHDPSPQAA